MSACFDMSMLNLVKPQHGHFISLLECCSNYSTRCVNDETLIGYIHIRLLSSVQNKVRFILHEPYDLS